MLQVILKLATIPHNTLTRSTRIYTRVNSTRIPRQCTRWREEAQVHVPKWYVFFPSPPGGLLPTLPPHIDVVHALLSQAAAFDPQQDTYDDVLKEVRSTQACGARCCLAPLLWAREDLR